ncbi:MAG: cardiolipin synthase [Pirellulaceae bacterium]
MYNWAIFGIVLTVFEVLGIISAIAAVMYARTSQGAIAWAAVLLAIPFISVPLFWIFGRSKFNGEVSLRRSRDEKVQAGIAELRKRTEPWRLELADEFGNARVLEQLVNMSFIRGNDCELLIDGPDTFAAMFDAIDRAREYVLAEFFIVHDDQLGREFLEKLTGAARRGCQVYLLYDDVGSHKMTRAYRNDLLAAGVQVSGMKTTKGWSNRFQLNFRNHRKIVVVDGYECYIGGHNVGDEYVHRSKKLTPWRDTHIKFEGPATMLAQVCFVEDWHWATGKIPQIKWEPQAAKNGADKTMFVLPSGPDDEYETCALFFTHLINYAKERLWIASPYFVPDEGIIMALQLAAMRGVDVRIMIPGLPDKWLVKRAAMAYVPQVAEAGIKMYEYGRGFLHQKAALIDDDISLVGTANFDNRSFRLNFEVSVLTIDEAFAKETEAMLQKDFEDSLWIDPAEFAQRSLWLRASSRVARLFSPIL